MNTTNPSSLEILKTYSFIFSSPQTDGAKPKIPLIHQVVLDPTQKFLLAPDLSADFVHVFGLDKDGMLVDPAGQAPLPVHPNSGPRHLVFYKPSGQSQKTYMYLVLEKANLLHGYEVLYKESGTLDFRNIYMGTVLGGDDLPAGAAAAEIRLTVNSLPSNHCSKIGKCLTSICSPTTNTSFSPPETTSGSLQYLILILPTRQL